MKLRFGGVVLLVLASDLVLPTAFGQTGTNSGPMSGGDIVVQWPAGYGQTDFDGLARV